MSGKRKTLRSYTVVDAISEIQRYHIIEGTGQEIPSDFLTVKGVLMFSLAGFQTGLLEGGILALLLPVCWGVWEGVIGAFGKTEADLIGKFLVFFFSFGVSLLFTSVFAGISARYCNGDLSRKAVDSLVVGRAFGLGCLGIVFFLFVIAIRSPLSPETVSSFCRATEGVLWDPDSLYYFIMRMKEPLMKSGLTHLICALIFGIVPLLTLWVFSKRR